MRFLACISLLLLLAGCNLRVRDDICAADCELQLIASEQEISVPLLLKSQAVLEPVIDSLDLQVSYFTVLRFKDEETCNYVPFKVVEHSQLPSQFRGKDIYFSLLDTASFELAIVGEETLTEVCKFNDPSNKFKLMIAPEEVITIDNLERIRKSMYKFKISEFENCLEDLRYRLSIEELEDQSIAVRLHDNCCDRATEALEQILNQYQKRYGSVHFTVKESPQSAGIVDFRGTPPRN